MMKHTSANLNYARTQLYCLFQMPGYRFLTGQIKNKPFDET